MIRHLIRRTVLTAAATAVICGGIWSGSADAAMAPANVKIAGGAYGMIGTPYLYGGTGHGGIDCSGLTQFVYGHSAHISLPRTADQQMHAMHWEPLAHAQKGDLVFFTSGGHAYHVGIIEGGGLMIDSATTGTRVALRSYHWGTRIYATVTHHT